MCLRFDDQSSVVWKPANCLSEEWLTTLDVGSRFVRFDTNKAQSKHEAPISTTHRRITCFDVGESNCLSRELYCETHALRFLQRLLNVGDEIGGVLDADGEADGGGGDAE